MRDVRKRHAPDISAAREDSPGAHAALMIEAPDVVHRRERQENDEVAEEELQPPDAPLNGEPLPGREEMETPDVSSLMGRRLFLFRRTAVRRLLIRGTPLIMLIPGCALF